MTLIPPVTPAPAVAPVPALKLKANVKPRVVQGHPWVFTNEIEALIGAEHDGTAIECRDRTGRFIGTGIYNSKSQIVWRRLSRNRITLDAAWIRGALERALARRAPGTARRLVWSESDELPGLVVDQFGDALVVQIQTLALDRMTPVISDLLAELLKPAEIIFRNDANIRRLEGLPLETHTRSGQPWAPRWVNIEGVEYWLDLESGQKTGFYLDQRAQHPLVAKFCAGKRVLDAFCNQGPFALHAARAGAAHVLGLDSSEEAIAAARRNAEHNGVKAEFIAANVFDWFNDEARSTETAKSKSALPGALRGYKELNLRALKALAPGGVLATYTCSHHMQDAELRSVLAEAAADARRRVQVLEFRHQPPDHPVLLTMPESEYLRGYIVRVE